MGAEGREDLAEGAGALHTVFLEIPRCCVNERLHYDPRSCRSDLQQPPQPSCVCVCVCVCVCACVCVCVCMYIVCVYI